MAVETSLLNNPVGHNMAFLAERLNHVRNIVDMDSWRVILDIGAADGWESSNFAKVLPDARVFAFEPVPSNQLRCQKTYGLMPIDIRSRITLVPAALGDVTGEIQFYAVDEEQARAFGNVNYGMGSMLKIVDPKVLPWENSVQKQINAQCYRIEDWCDQNNIAQVDLMWVDVQGAELHVFKGAGERLRDVQVIMSEAGVQPYYHGHTMKAEIDEYLAGFGFVEIESARDPHPQGLEINAIYVNQRFMR